MSPFRYFLFFCGQVGMMALARFFFQWILDYSAVKVAGGTLFAAAGISGAIFAFRIFDGITDPLAGTLSDRWVKAGKRRQILLWFPLLLPAIGLILCFAPTHAMVPGLRWALSLAGMFIFFVGYTFYAIPYWSLVDDYSQGDEKQRRVLSNLLGAGMLVASAVGFIISPLLVEKFGFLIAAIIFAAAGSLMMLGPIFAAPKGKGTRLTGTTAGGDSLFIGAKAALTDRRFLALLALYGGSQMSFTIMTSAAAFIVQDLLGEDRGKVSLLLGPLLGTAFLFFLLVPKISSTIGWLRGMLIAAVALGVVYGMTGFLGASLIGSPMITAAVLFAFGGPMIAVLLGLEAEGIVDCAKAKGGGDYVGMYWGVFNFVVKILNGGALFLLGLLTDLRDSWGTQAVRSMSFLAGGFLLLGVVLYFVIRPYKQTASSSS